VPDLQGPATGIAFLLSKTLPQLVQSEIERLILSGEVRAGERLNEVEIARRLNVSRGPVREALRSLEEAGLVRFEKNRGAAVRVISPDEAMHIYEVRACLEELACRRLASRITPEQLEALHALVERMEAPAASRDAATFHPLNMRFHELLVEFAGNGELAGVYRRLVGSLSLFRRHTLAQEGSLAQSNAEHRAILAHLSSRDAAAASRVMHGHIEASSKRTQQAFHLHKEEEAR
jgi:phosphonate utilization transcriptional regulator